MNETAQSPSLGNLAGGLTKLANTPQSSPLQDALSMHSEQIAKLGELVGQLAERLVPLRNMQPSPENNTQQAMPSSSQTVALLLDKTDEIRYLQSRINELLQDLEV